MQDIETALEWNGNFYQCCHKFFTSPSSPPTSLLLPFVIYLRSFFQRYVIAIREICRSSNDGKTRKKLPWLELPCLCGAQLFFVHLCAQCMYIYFVVYTLCAGQQEYSSRQAGITTGIVLACLIPILLIVVCVGYRLLKGRKEQREQDEILTRYTQICFANFEM